MGEIARIIDADTDIPVSRLRAGDLARIEGVEGPIEPVRIRAATPDQISGLGMVIENRADLGSG
jgi:hypothetical protein